MRRARPAGRILIVPLAEISGLPPAVPTRPRISQYFFRVDQATFGRPPDFTARRLSLLASSGIEASRASSLQQVYSSLYGGGSEGWPHLPAKWREHAEGSLSRARPDTTAPATGPSWNSSALGEFLTSSRLPRFTTANY